MSAGSPEGNRDTTEQTPAASGEKPGGDEARSADVRTQQRSYSGPSGMRPSGRGRDRARGRDRNGGRRDRRFRRPKRKVCAFCVDKVTRVDYKDQARLRDFISDRGKILRSRMTGTCARHQRKVSRAIKRARHIALLPFVNE